MSLVEDLWLASLSSYLGEEFSVVTEGIWKPKESEWEGDDTQGAGTLWGPSEPYLWGPRKVPQASVMCAHGMEVTPPGIQPSSLSLPSRGRGESFCSPAGS